MLTIGALTATDRTRWEEPFTAYLTFYGRTQPSDFYQHAWHRFQADITMHALGAQVDGTLVGITHFLFHPSTSGPDVCLLQDLFTAPSARGAGAATALIAAVTDRARVAGCSRVYWNTQESNDTARSLYNKVAEHRGPLRFEIDI